MIDFPTLRTAAARAASEVLVDRIELVEILDELDLLRRGGKAKPASKYSDEFESAWALYPSRPGNSKAAAFKAWAARLKAGATAIEMIDGTRKYANYCMTERTEPQYIKQAATFYGPGEHFSANWTPRRAVTTQEVHSDLVAAAMRKRRSGDDDFAGMTIDA